MQKNYSLSIIIDDDPIFVLLFKKILQNTNKFDEILHFEDGKIALDNIKELKKNNKIPDVIFLDINMPQLNGLAFLKEIHKSDDFDDLNIFMLSSSIDEKEIQQCLEHKMVRKFITKPVRSNDILEIL